MDICEVLAALEQGDDVAGGQTGLDKGAPSDCEDSCAEGGGLDRGAGVIHEISSSGMFALNAGLDIADREKLHYVCDALGHDAAWNKTGGATWIGSSEAWARQASEPCIAVFCGEDFADSFDA